MSIETLPRDKTRQRHGIDHDGDNFPLIEIHNAAASATVSLYGGQMLSYRPRGQLHDMLFLSSKSYFETNKAIRGGIPICWPWFGARSDGRPGANHGFARTSQWTLTSVEKPSDRLTRLRLTLSDSPESWPVWPYYFELELIASIGASLCLELVSRNTGYKPFSLTQALHAYFLVGDIAKTRLTGLEGRDFIDKMDDNRGKSQVGPLTVSKAIDRVYEHQDTPLSIHDEAFQQSIQILPSGNHNAIVWNPWHMATGTLPDLQENDYQRFLCVEPGNALANSITLRPGGECRLRSEFVLS